MEICRLSCGGHGFSHYSGIPSIIFEYSSNLTMEGENSILYLQVSRYLLKCYKYYIRGRNAIGQSAAYISSFDYLISLKVEEKYSPIKWNLETIRILFAQGICHLITKAVMKIGGKGKGMTETEVINYLTGMNLNKIGSLHSIYYTFTCFKQAIAN